MKVPVPVPLVVLVIRETVGPVIVDQTTPLPVIEEPPSAVIFPPLLAPVSVMLVTVVVVKVADNKADTVILPVAFTLPQPPVKGIV